MMQRYKEIMTENPRVGRVSLASVMHLAAC